MAISGSTMPALLIQPRNGEFVVAHRENRPQNILTHQVDEAETFLLSGGTVWIPASLRADLASKLGREIVPLAMVGA